jgi:hypothetical protein
MHGMIEHAPWSEKLWPTPRRVGNSEHRTPPGPGLNLTGAGSQAQWRGRQPEAGGALETLSSEAESERTRLGVGVNNCWRLGTHMLAGADIDKQAGVLEWTGLAGPSVVVL